MSTQAPTPAWDDEVDLRRWIAALIRYKWITLTFLVSAIALAAVVNYILLTPTYQSSGAVSLPEANGENGLGMTPRGYQEFASSNKVMDAVAQKLGAGYVAGQVRGQYSLQVDSEARLLTATASASTGEEAALLVDTWSEAFVEQVGIALERQYKSLKANREQEAELISQELATMESSLANFDLENPIDTMESRLAFQLDQLATSERRLLDLNLNLIPSDEAELAALQDLIDQQPATTGGSSLSVATPALEGGSSSESGALDPDYLDLGQELTRSRITSMERELVSNEASLRALILTIIPTNEAKAASLREALFNEPRILPQGTVNGVFTGPGTPNPVHVRLTRELESARENLKANLSEKAIIESKVANLERDIETLRRQFIANQQEVTRLREVSTSIEQAELIRGRLTASRQEVETLTRSIAAKEAETQRIRQDLANAKVSRARIEGDLNRLRESYSPTLVELDNVLDLEYRLEGLTSVESIRAASRPGVRVAPARRRNIAFAGVLGGFLGVLFVIGVEFYRGRPVVGSPRG